MRGLLDGLVREWRIIAGLALMYLWTWLIYWGGPFSLRGYTIELTNARWGVNVCMAAVAVGVVLVLSSRSRRRSTSIETPLRVASMTTGLLGTLLGLPLAVPLALPGSWVMPIALASGLFTGLCEGFLLCQWCTLTGSLGVRAALSHNAVALLFGGVLFLVCNAAPAWLSLGLGVACPVVGFLVSGRRGDNAEDDMPSTESPCKPLAALVGDLPFLVLAAIAFVFGLSNGFINAGFEIVPEQLYRLACYGVVVGTVLASGLTFLTAFVFKMDAWRLVFCLSLPLMAVAYFLFPYQVFWYVGWGVHALGYQFFFMTLWSLLGSRRLRHDVPAMCSVAAGLFAAELGSALGLALWNTLCVGIGPEGQHFVSGLALLVIVLVAVMFERPHFGWGDVRPGADPASDALRGDDYPAVLERARRDYGLSPRETEVLELLGRGRNRQFVADELGVSLETVKTHTTNVYRKLGVHSQQELLDVVEMVRSTLAQERQSAYKCDFSKSDISTR